jgi:hypothetical protein
VLLVHSIAMAADWSPVSPEEMTLRSEPKAPGAPAIYLFRQIEADDTLSTELHYERRKILTEAGLDQGTVEILLPSNWSVSKVQGRTIHADGSVVEFDGKVYRAPAGAEEGTRLTRTTFTLPAVTVGSILDYRYKIRADRDLLYNSTWPFAQTLFIKSLHLTLLPYPYGAMNMATHNLPPGITMPPLNRSKMVIDAHDLPPFVREELAPPEEQIEPRLEFSYGEDYDMDTKTLRDPTLFWNAYAKLANRAVDDFIGSNGAWQKVVAEIIQPGDSEETRLRKLYTRVQQLRQFPKGSEWTEEEIKENKDHAINKASDAWRQQRGRHAQINLLFFGLVRAAGIHADVAFAPARDGEFFQRKMMQPRALVAPLIAVKIGDRDVYLDPGTRNVPFGSLPWEYTANEALVVGRDGGRWVEVPLGKAADNRVERHAVLHCTADRTLSGTVEVTYTGTEALWRRARERGEDAATRRTFLENDLLSAIPVAGSVKLQNDPDWEGSDAPLHATFQVSIPEWAQSAGSRALFPVGVFSSEQRKLFVAAQRTQGIYFHFPYSLHDDVEVQLPEGWQVQSVPKPADNGDDKLHYRSSVSAEGRSLHLTRELSVQALFASVGAYDLIKTFFDSMRAADEDRAVVVAGGSAGH